MNKFSLYNYNVQVEYYQLVTKILKNINQNEIILQQNQKC